MKPITIGIVAIIVVILAGLVYRISSKTTSMPVDSVSPTPTITATVISPFLLTSPAFVEGQLIPSQFTCDGASTQPPLSWSNAPEDTKSFAITMYDPDVPKQVRPQGYFDHWAIFNIPATTTSLIASSTVGVQGNNGSGKLGYTGPCPPKEYQPSEHRYIFTIFALDDMLDLKKGATREDVEAATKTHTIASTTLFGRYEKK